MGISNIIPTVTTALAQSNNVINAGSLAMSHGLRADTTYSFIPLSQIVNFDKGSTLGNPRAVLMPMGIGVHQCLSPMLQLIRLHIFLAVFFMLNLVFPDLGDPIFTMSLIRLVIYSLNLLSIPSDPFTHIFPMLSFLFFCLHASSVSYEVTEN